MDRADRLLKRTTVKKEQLEETDSENWTTIARDVIGGVDARTPTKSSKILKRKGKSVTVESPPTQPAKKAKVVEKTKEETLKKVEKKKKETTKEKKVDDPTKEQEKKASEVTPLPAVVSTMAIEKVPGWAAIAIPYNYNELKEAFMDYNDFRWAAGKLNIRDHCKDQFLRDNWEAWRNLAALELKFVETRKFVFRGEVVVQEDPLIAPVSAKNSKRKRKVVGAVIPHNQRTKRPRFPEIDDVWIAPKIITGMTVDTKGKSKANEEEEQDPTPEDPKDSPAKPSGSRKPTPPYGNLPTKFEKFCSQFGSQRSEGIPDMFNDPESVQRIQFATSLLADVCSLQVVNTDKYNSQYSQQVDLASSSQTEREKIDLLEQRCLEAEKKLEMLKQNHTVLCARRDMSVHPDNIDAYIENPDLVPELTNMRNASERSLDTTWKEECSACKERIGFLPTMQPGSCACRYHFHCLWKHACTSSSCSNCGISFLPVMYQFFSNDFTGHVEKPPQALHQTNTSVTGEECVHKEEKVIPASKSTSAVSKSGETKVRNEVTSTPEKAGLLQPRKALFGVPLDLPESSSTDNKVNNSVLLSDTEFVEGFMGKMIPELKDKNIQRVIAEAPAVQSPELEVLKSTTGNILIVSPEKSAEKTKKREVRIPMKASDSLQPGRSVHSEVINCSSMRSSCRALTKFLFFAHTHWYKTLEKLLAEESPDSSEWDNEVLQKLVKHQKGLIPSIEKVDDIRYIVVLIHAESHWSLVLIHISDIRDACVIYHMDSIKTYHDHSQIGALLNTWLDLGLGLNMETSIVSIGITQQTNNFDCGVHVLYIITKLIEARKNGQLLEYLENGGLPKEWGTDEIVSKYRLEVRELLISLVESDT
ncbi:hypothetical protein R1sor_017573 [Riccia sorocarpa]|uniref:Ubiquitin-like protease family profile domain-containing protein n=1 Tax=Riccia sorocarpa TaxID=122646 RepID=A0ABD3IB91_9MARC